jgi:hypothetical protein
MSGDSGIKFTNGDTLLGHVISVDHAHPTLELLFGHPITISLTIKV